jgi:hypothetical protein
LKLFAFRVFAVLLGLALPLLLIEGVLRLLPVATGLHAQPVNAQAPVFHFEPDRDFTFSHDWNFSIVNHGRTNNVGYVNGQEYAIEGRHPVIGVVGDSFIEAAMVPYPETLHGRLAAELADQMRVYSFAAMGAPLSQYLIWMRHARQTYDVDALVVVVIGNDFDESLAEFKVRPGFHSYVDESGELVLKRFDFAPGMLRRVVRVSALARYLLLNLHADVTLARWLEGIGFGQAQAASVGDASSGIDPHRLAASRRGVEAFFRDLPAYADLPAQRILFVVDGKRYPGNPLDSFYYFNSMRQYFMAEARRRGYPVIDAEEYLVPYAKEHPEARFEWPTDGHWNGLAHGLIAQAILTSSWLDSLGP